eukprot:9482358-Pyramimonas_sp.AAC.2
MVSCNAIQRTGVNAEHSTRVYTEVCSQPTKPYKVNRMACPSLLYNITLNGWFFTEVKIA